LFERKGLQTEYQMGASTAKKVLVDRYDRSLLRGYVQPQTCRTADGLEVMSPEGAVSIIPYPQIKCVSFVRDLDGPSVLGERREFLARPKSAGLWIEFQFRDGDSLESTISNNMMEMEPDGLYATPPENAGNAQRIFVPRAGLTGVQVLGVVGKPKPKRERPAAPNFKQFKLFSDAEPA
jgi:hypothetical protein